MSYEIYFLSYSRMALWRSSIESSISLNLLRWLLLFFSNFPVWKFFTFSVASFSDLKAVAWVVFILEDPGTVSGGIESTNGGKTRKRKVVEKSKSPRRRVSLRQFQLNQLYEHWLLIGQKDSLVLFYPIGGQQVLSTFFVCPCNCRSVSLYIWGDKWVR